MILSMTGYGDAEACIDGLNYAVEIRSVNHRYFKAVIKITDWLQQFEPQIDKLLRGKLGRGSINYQLKVKSSGTAPAAAGQINTAALQSYLERLQAMPGASDVKFDLSGLLALPGVLDQQPEPDLDRAELWDRISGLTGQALDKLLTMRRDEGQAMADDLLRHTAEIRRFGDQVGQRAPQVVGEYQQRLRDRVNELLQNSGLELHQDDLLREVAIFAERCDISEETIRLGSHLEQFEQLVGANEHAGRKLEFMAQEMLREVNTIGSKANDSGIARDVVEMKGLIDRLKEQVQNVE